MFVEIAPVIYAKADAARSSSQGLQATLLLAGGGLLAELEDQNSKRAKVPQEEASFLVGEEELLWANGVDDGGSAVVLGWGEAKRQFSRVS